MPRGFTRRGFLETSVAIAGAAVAGPLLAQQPPAAAAPPRVKGPAVWLDMDQAELDAAYDQSKYAPNLAQITKRYATNSEAVRARLGAPRRFAYGPTPIEGLDGYSYLPAARADLLRRLGRYDEAAASYETALGLTDNAPGRIAIVVPPARFAPRWAAAITSSSPPVTTTQPRSARSRPTSSAFASCSAPLPITDTWRATTAILRP